MRDWTGFCHLHTGQDPGSHQVIMNVFRGGASLKKAETLAEDISTIAMKPVALFWLHTSQKSRPRQGFDEYDLPETPSALGNQPPFEPLNGEKQSGPVLRITATMRMDHGIGGLRCQNLCQS